MVTALRIREVWRYPVKSMLGERVPCATIDARGLVGDRLYAIEDANGKFGSGKTTRRFRLLKGLFDYEARTADGTPIVSLPDGRELPVGSPPLDTAVSERYGEELRITPEESISHFDVAPIHLISTASLRWLGDQLGHNVEARRFRPNLLIEAPGAEQIELGWLGAELHTGSCVLRVSSSAERCVMANNAQSELGSDPLILRTLARLSGARFGVYAKVVSPGVVSEGDTVDIRKP